MKRTLILLLVAALFALNGCGKKESGTSGGGAGDKNSLVIAFDVSPSNLDSRVGNDIASARIFDMAYAALIKFGKDGGYEPDVAEKWETPDDKTIVFHLRPNVKFQDGRPLTSKDVKYTYDSMLAPNFTSSKKSGYTTVASIEAPDDKTVIFHLKEPNGGIFDNLAVGIVPQGADTNTFKTKPIGAGPYKVIDYKVDDRVELEAFDGYYGGAPHIKHVIFRIIPDATTRVLELKKGTANFEINSVPFDTVDSFQKDSKFKVERSPGAVYQYLAFNLRDPILSKQPVREAIAHAIDRQKIVSSLLLGYGHVTDTLFPPGHWARAENLPSYNYDPAKAKQLLDSAGYKDPDGDGPQPRFKLLYKTSTDQEANQQAEMIQQMLRQVGIEVEIRSNEFAVFYEDIQKGNFQLFSLRRSGVSDPDFYYTIFHSKSVPPDGQNRGYYSNPKVDQLIEQGRSTFDQSKRKEAYAQVQQIVAQELPYLSLYHRDNVAIMRSNIQGFEMYPSGFLLSVPKMTIQ